MSNQIKPTFVVVTSYTYRGFVVQEIASELIGYYEAVYENGGELAFTCGVGEANKCIDNELAERYEAKSRQDASAED